MVKIEKRVDKIVTLQVKLDKDNANKQKDSH